jgi:hypothetical protein
VRGEPKSHAIPKIQMQLRAFAMHLAGISECGVVYTYDESGQIKMFPQLAKQSM